MTAEGDQNARTHTDSSQLNEPSLHLDTRLGRVIQCTYSLIQPLKSLIHLNAMPNATSRAQLWTLKGISQSFLPQSILSSAAIYSIISRLEKATILRAHDGPRIPVILAVAVGLVVGIITSGILNQLINLIYCLLFLLLLLLSLAAIRIRSPW